MLFSVKIGSSSTSTQFMQQPQMQSICGSCNSTINDQDQICSFCEKIVCQSCNLFCNFGCNQVYCSHCAIRTYEPSWNSGRCFTCSR